MLTAGTSCPVEFTTFKILLKIQSDTELLSWQNIFKSETQLKTIWRPSGHFPVKLSNSAVALYASAAMPDKVHIGESMRNHFPISVELSSADREMRRGQWFQMIYFQCKSLNAGSVLSFLIHGQNMLTDKNQVMVGFSVVEMLQMKHQ